MLRCVRLAPALAIALGLSLIAVPAFAAFPVTFGSSWDSASLQSILDAEYGVGTINAATDYVGYNAADPDPYYWQDVGLDGLILREVAGYRNTNIMGWYEETFVQPVIDGVDDGVVFTGPMVQGQSVSIAFPSGTTRFGFYLNPNGAGDSTNAPEPEKFFTNRFYNDIGPAGCCPVHPPFDGDPQVLVYDISHLFGGRPTFVLAWEDIDYGSPITPAFTPTGTDDDFQDLVVEIQAFSPVPDVQTSWGKVKSLYGH
jgi:hypothetical protein